MCHFWILNIPGPFHFFKMAVEGHLLVWSKSAIPTGYQSLSSEYHFDQLEPHFLVILRSKIVYLEALIVPKGICKQN